MAWNDGLDPKSPAYQIAECASRRIRVVAGPGTGKSFAMKRRVARLLEDGVDPEDILAVTFTRVAAQDLHRELSGLGVPGCERLSGRTLHGLGLQILSRRHVLTALGRTPRPLNNFEEDAMICDLAVAHGGKNACKKLRGAYLAAWARAQGDVPGFPPGSAEKAFADDILAWLTFHGAMLVGEIVPYLLVYLKHNPAAQERSEFKHVLVDEYQDLNRAEQTIIEYLSEDAHVCIVGDDDQSIYSFKFAHPEGIREWGTSEPRAEDFVLSLCHRCPTQVVQMANALISNNANRDPRQLEELAANGKGAVHIFQFDSIDDEAAWIAHRVTDLIKSSEAEPGDIIVLVQREVIGRKILDSLRAAGVPVRSYYDENQLDTEAAHIRFALFKLFLNNEDRPALRYLLGTGGSDMRAPSYAKLRSYCEEHGRSPWEVLTDLDAGKITIKSTSNLVDAFRQLHRELDQLGRHVASLAEFVNHLFPEGDDELAELRRLAVDCIQRADTPEALRDEMMQELTKPEVPPPVTDVRVMSLHKSKGLSSPYVFVAGCVQGLLPKLPDATLPSVKKQAIIEEQRRIVYVAITRVKAEPRGNRPGTLYLTHSKEMPSGLAKQAGIVATHRGYVADLQASAFLAEMAPAAPVPRRGPTR